MIHLFGWGIILYLTRGYFQPTLIYALIPLILLAWGSVFFTKNLRPELTTRLYYALISLFCFLNGFQLLVIYPKNAGLLIAVKWVFHSLSLLFGLMSVLPFPKERLSSLILKSAIGVLAMCLFSIPIISPEPYIDVWYHTELALYRLFAFGDNPYSYLDYPQLYREYHSTFVYPPVCLYVLAPFRLMSIDIRFGMAALIAASSLFFYFSADKLVSTSRKLLVPVLFLSFPATYFVLEQSWMDPISVFFLSLALLLKSKNKTRWFEVSLGFFLASKHYNILCLPVLLFWLGTKWNERFKSALRVVTISFLTFLPFLIWDYKALISRMLPGAPYKNPVYYCLNSWLGQNGFELPNSVSLLWIMFSTIGVFFFWRKSEPSPDRVFALLSAVLVTFFTLYSNTAMNYHWFSLIGFWVACHYRTTRA